MPQIIVPTYNGKTWNDSKTYLGKFQVNSTHKGYCYVQNNEELKKLAGKVKFTSGYFTWYFNGTAKMVVSYYRNWGDYSTSFFDSPPTNAGTRYISFNNSGLEAFAESLKNNSSDFPLPGVIMSYHKAINGWCSNTYFVMNYEFLYADYELEKNYYRNTETFKAVISPNDSTESYKVIIKLRNKDDEMVTFYQSSISQFTDNTFTCDINLNYTNNIADTNSVSHYFKSNEKEIPCQITIETYRPNSDNEQELIGSISKDFTLGIIPLVDGKENTTNLINLLDDSKINYYYNSFTNPSETNYIVVNDYSLIKPTFKLQNNTNAEILESSIAISDSNYPDTRFYSYNFNKNNNEITIVGTSNSPIKNRDEVDETNIVVTLSLVDNRGYAYSFSISKENIAVNTYTLPQFTNATIGRALYKNGEYIIDYTSGTNLYASLNTSLSLRDWGNTIVKTGSIIKITSDSENDENNYNKNYSLAESEGKLIISENEDDYNLKAVSRQFSLNLSNRYTVEFTLMDSFGSVISFKERISSAQYLIHIPEQGNGIGFGASAKSNGEMAVGFVPNFYSEKASDNPLPINQGGTGANTSAEAIMNLGIIDLIYPVGSIYMSVNNTNPSLLFSGTAWEPWGAGRVPVGVDANDSDFASAGLEGGEKAHTLTVEEMPSHVHEGKYLWREKGSTKWTDFIMMERATHSNDYRYASPDDDPNKENVEIQSPPTGGSQPHNNLQPYITCYMWKRISITELVDKNNNTILEANGKTLMTKGE